MLFYVWSNLELTRGILVILAERGTSGALMPDGLHHAILYVLSARWRENNILEFFGVWHANQLQTKYSINTNKCGDLEIPYPFGVNEGCSLDETFLITCNNNKVEKSNKVTVKSISIEDHEMRVSQLVA